MADKMKLTGIGLTTPDGDPVKLTVTQARDLYTQLHELFGRDETRQIIIERDRWPIPWRPYRPFWVAAPGEGETRLPRGEPRIMCKAASGLAVSYLGKES